jgi:hypothetical protein
MKVAAGGREASVSSWAEWNGRRRGNPSHRRCAFVCLLQTASGRGLSNFIPFGMPLKLSLREKINNLVICKTVNRGRIYNWREYYHDKK